MNMQILSIVHRFNEEMSQSRELREYGKKSLKNATSTVYCDCHMYQWSKQNMFWDGQEIKPLSYIDKNMNVA